jgi:hypothetical protein
MTDQPTLRQQIEAVEWALDFIDWRSPAAADPFKAAMETALETLKCLQFMREVLN